MPEPADKRSSGGEDAFTAGCLLLLVLVADAAAVLLGVIVAAVRSLSRNSDSAQTVTGTPPADWTPVLCFGALTLAVCATGVLLLRLGHRYIGAAQLALCIVPAVLTLGSWP